MPLCPLSALSAHRPFWHPCLRDGPCPRKAARLRPRTTTRARAWFDLLLGVPTHRNRLADCSLRYIQRPRVRTEAQRPFHDSPELKPPLFGFSTRAVTIVSHNPARHVRSRLFTRPTSAQSR